MNKAQAQRVISNSFDSLIDWRKLKRAENITFEVPGLYEAYCRGVRDGYRAPRSNPYPPGKRHKEWQTTYDRIREDLVSGNRARHRNIDPN